MFEKGKRLTSILTLTLIILSFLIASYAYNQIEEDKVASHWNAKGEVDGYMSKFWGLFLFPFILIAFYLLFLAIPKIDPLKKNIEKFMRYYNGFILVFTSYMFYVFILTVLANLGYDFNMTTMIVPSVGLLFFYIGIFMNKIEMNWFIGIRTPWTLSNKKVWDKTHQLASKLFKILGIIICLSIFLPYTFWIIISSVFIVVIWTILYSYLEYRKIENK